jgi:hypothetical protein
MLPQYAKVLFHLGENCNVLKKKNELREYSFKLVEVLANQGIQIGKVQKLAEAENTKTLFLYLEQNKHEYVILSRALFLIGKQEFRKGNHQSSLKFL